jgi:hypothetical protein
MMAETGLNFIHTRGPIFYCESPKRMSDQAYYKIKSREMKYKQLSHETFHEDVAKAINESSWKPFLALIEPKFRALVSHEGYSMDWHAYCCNLLKHVE